MSPIDLTHASVFFAIPGFGDRSTADHSLRLCVLSVSALRWANLLRHLFNAETLRMQRRREAENAETRRTRDAENARMICKFSTSATSKSVRVLRDVGSARLGRPRTAALRQKSLRVFGSGASVPGGRPRTEAISVLSVKICGGCLQTLHPVSASKGWQL